MKTENRSPKDYHKQRARPEAMVTTTSGEASYADILKMIKSNPQLTEIEETVNTIRKTAKGEMLLEFRSKTYLLEQNFPKELQEPLNYVVKNICKEITFECHDINEITTTADICTALTSQLRNLGM